MLTILLHEKNCQWRKKQYKCQEGGHVNQQYHLLPESFVSIDDHRKEILAVIVDTGGEILGVAVLYPTDFRKEFHHIKSRGGGSYRTRYNDTAHGRPKLLKV